MKRSSAEAKTAVIGDSAVAVRPARTGIAAVGHLRAATEEAGLIRGVVAVVPLPSLVISQKPNAFCRPAASHPKKVFTTRAPSARCSS